MTATKTKTTTESRTAELQRYYERLGTPAPVTVASTRTNQHGTAR